jgi:trk system potassium uptake protein
MVRMRDVEYRQIYEDAGVHQILSETEILVGALATAIEHEAVAHSMVLGSGEAVAAEIAIGARSTVVGKTVSEVAQLADFPRSCVIAGMWTGGLVQAPRGASALEAGMRILIVTGRADLGTAIDLFIGTEQKQ